MSAYLPGDLATAALLGLALVGVLLLGFATTRLRTAVLARGAAWALVLVGTSAVERLSTAQPAGFRMVALILALLWSLKAVVTVESQADGRARLRPWQWLAFTTLWPGMRPGLFAAAGGPARAGGRPLLWSGAGWLASGAVLVGLARLVWVLGPSRLSANTTRLLATILLLPGLSLIVHFGIFSLLAGAWRWAGVDCRPLFRAPLASKSLMEFWGRRWNLAFSEMTALAVYRPLAARAGVSAATVAAFLFSGVLHELAISVPVGAGYGLPLLYFTLHGGLVLGERRLQHAGRPVDRSAWRGRLWTLAWLGLPLPILFHPPFLRGVLWPLLGMGD